MKAIQLITLFSLCSPLMAMSHDLMKCGDHRENRTFTKSTQYPQEVINLVHKREHYRDRASDLIRYKVENGLTTYIEIEDEDLTDKIMALPMAQRAEVLKEIMIKNDKAFQYNESSYSNGNPEFTQNTIYNGSILVRGDEQEWTYNRGLGKCRRIFRTGNLYQDQTSSEDNRISYRGARFEKVTFKGFSGFQDAFKNIWGNIAMREGAPLALTHEMAKKYCEQMGAHLPTGQQIIDLFKQLGGEDVESMSFRALKGKNLEVRTSDNAFEVFPGLELEQDLELPMHMENVHYDWKSGLTTSRIGQSTLGHFRCVKRKDDHLY